MKKIEVLPSGKIDFATEKITGMWRSAVVKLDIDSIRKEPIGLRSLRSSIWLGTVTTTSGEEVECPLHCLQIEPYHKGLIMKQYPKIVKEDFIIDPGCNKFLINYQKFISAWRKERKIYSNLLSEINIPVIVG